MEEVSEPTSETESASLSVQMFRAVYRQIVRFLDWINGSGSGSSASQATREAADHRHDVEIRSDSGPGGWGL